MKCCKRLPLDRFLANPPLLLANDSLLFSSGSGFRVLMAAGGRAFLSAAVLPALTMIPSVTTFSIDRDTPTGPSGGW